MKRTLYITFAVFILSITLILTACNDDKSNITNNDQQHSHSYNMVITAPTCLTEGYTTFNCLCGDTYKDHYIAASGHSFGTWTVTKNPACNANGEERKYCNCGAYEIREIEASEHTFGSWVETIPPTCSTLGEEKRTCECGEFEIRIINPYSHNYTTLVTAPTCTERGYTTYLCYCSDTYVDNYVDPLGHDLNGYSFFPPTCTSIGWESYDSCSRCEYTTYVELDALSHTPGNWIVDKDATFTEEGLKHKECTMCGTTIETSTIPMLYHSYISVVTNPTCTEQGYTIHTCSKCGDVYTDDYTPALDHSLGEWMQIKSPTCVEHGIENSNCIRCDHFISRTINKINHTYTSIVVSPNCTERGYTMHTCSCGDSYKDSFVNAKGHTFFEWWTTVVEPTCTKNGEQRLYCFYCDFYQSNILPATGDHQYMIIIVSVPSCTQKGEDKYSCKCGYSYSIYYNELGHSHWSWEIIRNPTLTEEGIEQRGCYTCGELETRPIPIRDASEGLEMTLNPDGRSYSVTGIGTCTDLDIYIPAEHKGLPVIAIGDSAFSKGILDYYYIRSVYIPEGVVKIGGAAFLGCASLHTIVLPETLTHIGGNAFISSGIENINIPSNIVSIPDGVFTWCNNIKYNEYDGGLYLGNDNNPYLMLVKVRDTSIIKFTIHGNTEILYSGAFSNCKSLTNIIIPNSVKSIMGEVFYNCSSLTSITIPSEVSVLSKQLFLGCYSLKDIFLPESVQIIERGVFYDCISLENINIPNGIIDIEEYAFENCSSLKYNEYKNALYLGNEINPYLILIKAKSTNINNCEINQSAKAIYYKAFYNCSLLKSIIIPQGVNSINEETFANCTSLIEVIIPDSVISVNTGAFRNCSSLTNVTLPNNIKDVGYEVFLNCTALKSLNIPHGVTSIPNSMFNNCTALENINIPDSVTSIDSYAFTHCTSLKSITIPDDVTSIGYSAFSKCTSLVRITIPQGVTIIQSSTFLGCTSLAYVSLPDTLIKIENNAFQECSALKTINIPKKLESIGACAFQSCFSLTITAAFGNSLKEIDAYAFYSCYAITNLIIPSSVNSIGQCAFENCYSLGIITLTESTDIADSAFRDAYITDVYFEGTTEKWKDLYNKSSCWSSNNSKFTVYCADGIIIEETWN